VSLATDTLAAMYGAGALTVPALFGTVTRHGYFDRTTVQRVDEASGMALQGTAITLRVAADAWTPMPVAGTATVRVGTVGAATVAASAPQYRVREVLPDGDGLETVLVLVPN
jgi:hypothetical protein